MNRNKGSVQGLFRWVGVGVLVFVAGTPPAMGQAQVFPQWTARLHFANASVSPVTIAADAQGNSFSTGAVCLERTDTSCLNAESLTLKYDADGNLKWKRFLSSPVHQATGVDVGADAAGNAYVLSLLWLGQDQVNGLKDAEFVTAKYDPAGVRLWIDFFHIPNTDNIPVKLAVGATGAVYVTGTTAQPMSNPNEVTTVKYDTNGHLVWARRTPVFDLAAQLLVGVGLDGNETTYVATNRENAGIPDTTIFRYDKNGNPETPFSPGFGFINDFRVDAGGNSYLAGGSVPFPQFAPSDLLVAKLDPTGKSLWQDDVSSQFQPPPAGTVESALNAAIAPDSTGDTYYAQTALHSDGTTDTTLIKFDTKGVQQWLARSGGRVSSVLVNFIGDAYVSAHSITKYSAAGKALWTEPAGAATTIGGDGGLFVVGSSSSGTSADWVTIDYIQDAAKLTPAMLSFGNEALGKQSALQTVTLTNTGERNLIIKSIPVSGDFHLTNNCPTTLAAGASCKLGITFTPTELGARTGTLSVLDDWEGSEHNPQTVKLSGTGVTP